eukprot:2758442-Lingulodinium_polyedra.AAC.1
MDRPWTILSMDWAWTGHGLSMDCPWTTHGQTMANGQPIDNPWRESMDNTRPAHGQSMDFHGQYMANQWQTVDSPWTDHGQTMAGHWAIHGLSVDCPWIVHGQPMDIP